MPTTKRIGLWLGIVLLGFASAGKAEGLRDRYFMVLFGYQGASNRAVDAHTFAAFYEGSDLESGRVSYPASISWLPATGVVRPLRREPGKNFSLEETLDLARRNGAEVRAHGPYEITSGLFARAMEQIRFLESGAVDYRMINGIFVRGTSNCIAAVSAIGGSLNTGTQWGFSATQRVATHLSRWTFGFPSANNNVARLIRLDEMLGR